LGPQNDARCFQIGVPVQPGKFGRRVGGQAEVAGERELRGEKQFPAEAAPYKGRSLLLTPIRRGGKALHCAPTAYQIIPARSDNPYHSPNDQP